MRALWPLKTSVTNYEVLLSDWRPCFSSSLYNHIQYIKYYNSTIFFLVTEQLHKNSSSVITMTTIRHVLTLFHMRSKILHIHRGRGRIPHPSIPQAILDPRSLNLVLLKSLAFSFQKCQNNYAN